MRSIEPYIAKDLQKKMVFLGGPRQCGKTTLAKHLLKTQKQQGRYFNFDFDEDRKKLIAREWQDQDRLLIFDELHKFHRWKNWVKGVFDVSRDKHQILVTGSARLDIYKRGGDSLLGRYHYWRLHPFTLDELPPKMKSEEALKRLMTVGGFPEPFLDGNEKEARRWRRERYDRIIRDDIRDLEMIQNINGISMLLELLRSRVGGQIVVSNLAEDLQVASKTVAHWLEILSRMYLIFIVMPYSKNLARAVRKPPKIYFFDNADVQGDEGARFENLVAAHLLKRIHFLEDSTGYRYELRYIRDKEDHEVDFVILKEGQIEELIEVKLGDEKISGGLVYFSHKLNSPKSTQIVFNLSKSYSKNNIHVVSPLEYFSFPA